MNMIAEGFLTEMKIHDSVDDIELSETKNIPEILLWMNRFIKNYKGNKNKIPVKDLVNSQWITRNILIQVKGNKIGFIRVLHRIDIDINIWALDCVYIKPEYRGKGFYKTAIIKLVELHKLNAIRIDQDVAIEYKKFFKSVGFDKYIKIGFSYFLMNCETSRITLIKGILQ